MSMTATEVKNLIDQLWTRAGSDRVDDADLRTVGNAIVDMVAALDVDIFPDWDSGLTFQTDGSDDGKYCKHPDSNGKKRIWETKTDDNTGNEPPTDPLITSDPDWQEISQSAKSGIVEWSAGLFGEGFVVVAWNHSTDGNNFYKLEEPERPFASTNIETEIAAGKWSKFIDQKNEIIRVEVPLSAAQIKGMKTARVDLLPSPGENKLIKVLDLFWENEYGTTPFDFAAQGFYIGYETEQGYSSTANSFFNASADTTYYWNGNIAAVIDGLGGDKRNKALSAWMGTSDATVGDSTARVIIYYKIVDLS